MNLTLIAAFISAGVAGLAGWGAAWTIQGRTIDSLKLEARDAIISQQRAARAVTERLTSQVAQAQAQAALRNDRARADARSAGDAGNGLRVASTDSVRTATNDINACGAIVRAYDVILQEGGQLLREVAATADQCISDNQALTDAWPR